MLQTKTPDEASHGGRPRERRRLPGPVGLFSAALFVCYSTYAVVLHERFRTGGFDLGIFDQAVRDYARFDVPIVPIRGEGLIHLGDHFHPILATLAPLYWIWDDPRVLVIAQAALVCSAIPVVHRFSMRRLQHWSAWCVTFGFALGWPIQQMVHFHFHEVAFAVPLLAVALDALDRRADRTLVIACIALLLVREDMGLLVALMGLLRAWTRPRLLGAALVVTGLASFVLVTQVVMARLAPAGEWAYWSYDALGEDPPSAILTILTQPWQAVQLLFSTSVKQFTWLGLFLPLLWMPLLSRYVVVVLPLLAAQFFTSRELLWLPSYHYWAPLWVILIFASVDGLARLRRVSRIALPAVPVFLAALTALGVLLAPGLFPLRSLASASLWEVDPHVELQRAILEEIPEGTCVEADNRLVPHLTPTNKVSVPGVLEDPPPDYIALDLSQVVGDFRSDTPQEAQRDAEAEGYVEVWRRGDLVLYRSPDYRGPSPGCAA